MNGEVRIKKGVTPFGGRRLTLLRAGKYPNGRVVAFVKAPGGKAGWMHHDERLYELHELEPLDDKAREALANPQEVGS